MQWVKQNNSLVRYLLLALFVVAFLATHIPLLDVDEINPDAVNWHFRSEQFIVALKGRNFLNTYQHYHPGVTLMWVMGVPVEIVKHLSPVNKTYTLYNFETFHFVSKLSLVTVELVLTILIIYLLTQILDFYKAFFFSIFLTYEPFFFGNARILHMDVLFTLLSFVSLLFAYLFIKNYLSKPLLKIFPNLFFAAFFAGLAFLTRSIGIGLFLFEITFVPLFILYQRVFMDKKKLFVADPLMKKLISAILLLVLTFCLTIFALFPALWVKPLFVIRDIFSEGTRIGVRKGHGQIILGDYTRDAGVFFYPLTLAMKVSPFTLIFVSILIIMLILKKVPLDKRFILFVGMFYLGYFLVMTYPSKKVDRYMVPIYPFLNLLALYGYLSLLKLFVNPVRKKMYILLCFTAFVLFNAYPITNLFPYDFLYTSPLFGNAQNANNIVAQKSFGIGIHAVKDLVINKYGYYPKMGFIDTKPMRSIYRNSRIFDMRVNGTSDYNIAVLGVNEEFPDKVYKSDAIFKKDASIYINGLEYWRVYVKKIK